MKHEFSLLSLNTFGIPFHLSWRRLARLARKLECFETTLICLQEIQQHAYATLLTRRLKSYPYKAVFPHIFAPKGGLGTFSMIPLTLTRFEPYRDRGLRWLVSFADWALFKGVLVSHFRIDELEVLILNTHLNANYSGVWHLGNPLAQTQQRQVQQLAQLVNELPSEALIVLCGDFNFPRASFLYEELISQAGLTDPLQDDPRPTYRPFPLVPASWKISLDYLLLRIPEGRRFNIQADIVAIEDTTKKYAWNRFLTDHCALTLRINW